MLKGDQEPLEEIPEQFLILVTCRDEKQQMELLERFSVVRWSAGRWLSEG
jgi:hypothetical protein